MNIEEMLKAGRKLAKKMENDRRDADNVLITFQVPRKFRTELMEKVRANHLDFSEYLRQCCQTLLDYPTDTASKEMKKTNKAKLAKMVEEKHQSDS